MDIREGEIRTLQLNNVSICGFSAVVFANCTDGLSNLEKSDLDWSKMMVRCVLTRNGLDLKMFNMSMLEMLSLTSFLSPRYDQIFGGQNYGISAPGKSQFPVRFGFGQLNLKNSDVLNLEVTLNSGFFDTDAVSLASSYVRIDGFKAVGVEYSTPEVLVYTIEANASESKLSLGSCISKIMYFAKNSTAMPAVGANAVSNVVLSCDKIKKTDKFIDLVNQRVDQFPSQTISDFRGENFVIHTGSLLNDVSLETEFNPANVPVGVYKIIAVRENTSNQQLTLADATTAMHQYENAQAMGVNLTAAQRADYARLQAIKTTNLQA
jgi:hypothetical protein